MKRPDRHRDVTTVRVVELMSHPVVCVTPQTSLGDALAAMLRTGLRHLVVVDADHHCRGVLSDRAVTAAWAADPSALAWQWAGALLDPRPAVIGEESTVADAARLMYLDRVDATAVIDRAGHPVGVLTGSDLVALMATHVTRRPDEAELADEAASSDEATVDEAEA
jgi:CBS domain-containing protein